MQMYRECNSAAQHFAFSSLWPQGSITIYCFGTWKTLLRLLSAGSHPSSCYRHADCRYWSNHLCLLYSFTSTSLNYFDAFFQNWWIRSYAPESDSLVPVACLAEERTARQHHYHTINPCKFVFCKKKISLSSFMRYRKPRYLRLTVSSRLRRFVQKMWLTHETTSTFSVKPSAILHILGCMQFHLHIHRETTNSSPQQLTEPRSLPKRTVYF